MKDERMKDFNDLGKNSLLDVFYGHDFLLQKKIMC